MIHEDTHFVILKRGIVIAFPVMSTPGLHDKLFIFSPSTYKDITYKTHLNVVVLWLNLYFTEAQVVLQMSSAIKKVLDSILLKNNTDLIKTAQF